MKQPTRFEGDFSFFTLLLLVLEETDDSESEVSLSLDFFALLPKAAEDDASDVFADFVLICLLLTEDAASEVSSYFFKANLSLSDNIGWLSLSSLNPQSSLGFSSLTMFFSLGLGLTVCFAKAFSIVFFCCFGAGLRLLEFLLDFPDLFFATTLEPASASSRS